MPRSLVLVFATVALLLAGTGCKDEAPDVQVREHPPLPDEPGADTPPPAAPTEPTEPDRRTMPPPSADARPENPTFLRTVEPDEPFVTAPPHTAESFRALVAERLEAEPALYVDAWWTAGEPPGMAVAELCADAEDAWHHNWFLVRTSTGALYTLPFQAQSRALCGGPSDGRGLGRSLEARAADAVPIELFDADLYGRFTKRHIVEDAAGRLVEARAVGSRGAGAQGDSQRELAWDWQLGRFWIVERAVEPGSMRLARSEEVALGPSSEPLPGTVRGGLLVPVRRELAEPPAALDPQRDLVVPGGDAGLRVAAAARTEQRNATARPQTTLLVELTRLDDAAVAAAGDGLDALRAADHLELWWCATAACSDEGLREGLRAVALALDESGAPRLAWLAPQGHDAPLPSATQVAPGRVVVELPLEALAPERDTFLLPAGSSVYPFTAVSVDRDPDGATPMRLATSALEPGREAATLGRLVALPGLEEAPRVGRPLGPEARIVAPGDVTSEPESLEEE